MAWFPQPTPDHVGYIVGFPGGSDRTITITGTRLRQTTKLHELTSQTTSDSDVPPDGLPILAFQLACNCGWRSEPIHSPHARWYPSRIELHNDHLEADARTLWQQHSNHT